MSIENLTSSIDKKYGKGVIQLGNTMDLNIPILSSTGSYILDDALGCMGIPKGRILELYGPPSGGKTTFAIHMMREVQKKDGLVAFIDLENSFDPEWATNIGINLEKLLIVQPTTGDEAFDIMEMMVKSNEIKFIVLDSVSAIVTKAVLEGEYGDAHIGQTARLMSQGLAKLNSTMTYSDTSIVFINQIRNKIGSYGNPEVTSGGLALQFYSSIRLDIRRKDVIGLKEEPEGFVTKIKVVKNKCGPPFKIAEVDLYIGKNGIYGIDNFSEVISVAITKEIIKKTGAWYKYEINGQEERWQGKNNVVSFMKENDVIYNELKNKIFNKSILENNPINGSIEDIKNKEVKKRKKKEEIIDDNTEEINIEEENIEEKKE